MHFVIGALRVKSMPTASFFHIFSRLLIFSKSSFSKTSYRSTIKVSNSVDPDQARHFVGSDLGPNCLQRLSADGTCRQQVNYTDCI